MVVTPAPRHEDQARQKFDKWSESLTFQMISPWLAFIQGHVLDRINWPSTKRVLDVACGSGLAVYESARRLQLNGGGIACGCDLSAGMLSQRMTDHPAAEHACFLVSSGQSLPYKDASFDAVICTVAFHHFPDPGVALREFRRILRPDGQVLIADHCRDLSFGVWLWDRFHRWFEKGHVMYYRTEELVKLFHGAGLENIEVTRLNPSYAETKKLIHHAAVFSATSPA